MVDTAEVRRIAERLPGVTTAAEPPRFGFEVGGKGVAWTYLQRVAPKKPRQPNFDVLAVRCPIEEKEMLIEAAPDIYFDDDHYRGFPAVLIRLREITAKELEARLRRAIEVQSAPKRRRR